MLASVAALVALVLAALALEAAADWEAEADEADEAAAEALPAAFVLSVTSSKLARTVCVIASEYVVAFQQGSARKRTNTPVG